MVNLMEEGKREFLLKLLVSRAKKIVGQNSKRPKAKKAIAENEISKT